MKLATAEKALRQLHANGIIDIGYRKVLLLDPQGLQEMGDL